MTAKKSRPVSSKARQPRSFSAVIRHSPNSVQEIARSLRQLVYNELPDADERFYGGRRPMAMYRTTADVCWIQPQQRHCNIYFPRGIELTDPKQLLEGTSDRFKYAKLRSLDDLEPLPLRRWLRESVQLNLSAVGNGIGFDDVLQRLRVICLAMPKTKETLTWGIPHFRVCEKIFCGCAEIRGCPQIGLKMDKHQAELMMKMPGIVKAPYSRKGDGWVTIDPNRFDDWEEIQRLLVESHRLVAPKRAFG